MIHFGDLPRRCGLQIFRDLTLRNDRGGGGIQIFLKSIQKVTTKPTAKSSGEQKKVVQKFRNGAECA